ncbi:histidine phosphatase family protein [Wenxinia marina]|uniref:Fructose-2,6-bisphosphatase n=1 Tax=Wenxinia marina DSM 24838 TaxID=1123501 RepID=A0A0D0QI04_9RHOB|nr:histidine phosphatase family protein [Wenxinia marina]KIQ70663.1 Fructose-2,6-bisphosphatase [Wenxinia marina DSM 24838]GGL51427.1 fructose 2,6-bisphosphatase [Wenxinia marina]
MGEIVMVRHGQANTGAATEEEYDRLSPLGHRQAGWLGEWLRANEAPFDAVLSGTMRRHRETAEAMRFPPQQADERLNELDYFALARDLQVHRQVPPPGTPEDFADHVPQTFAAWHAAEIAGAEPFASFEARVRDVLDEAATPGRRVLCVTSGGVIAMAMRLALGLDPERLAHVLLPIHNSSLHRFRVREGGTYLSAFNAIPHLDPPDRASARTFL